MLDWKSILGRKFKGGVMKIIITLGVEVEPSTELTEQPFSDEIQELLKSGKVIAACDALVKNGVMGAYWVMMTREKEELMSHELHTKEWNFNTSKTAEAVILLDLIATLREKARNTNQGKVDVHMYNKEIWRRVNTTTRVANHFNQDSAAEIKAIENLIKKAYLDIMLIREQGHREVRQAFHQNPGPKLILMCDKKVREIRLSAATKEISNNIRHYGKQVITKGGQIVSLPVKELIREIDAEEEECNYINSKFEDRAKLVNRKARINIKKIPLTESAMKFYYGCNHYGERDKIKNVVTSTAECPRCSEIETWEHVVQCRSTVSMRAEFILSLYEDLKKVQVPRVADEELRALIEDVRKFMREYLVDFETNQQVIGIKYLFRGFSVKAWKGTEFGGNKYTL